MNTVLNYDKELNLMHQSLHGECSIRNLAEVFDEMEKFEVKPGLRILADITDANLQEANYGAVSFLEQKMDGFLDQYLPVRKAIVVESVLEFGIARMYELLAQKEGFEIKVFRDLAQARKWLKI